MCSLRRSLVLSPEVEPLPREECGVRVGWGTVLKDHLSVDFPELPLESFLYLQFWGDFFFSRNFNRQLSTVFCKVGSMSCFVPRWSFVLAVLILLGSDQTIQWPRGGMAKDGSVEGRVGAAPLAGKSSVVSLSLTTSSTCPVSPLRGRKSMGPVHCIFRKRNAILERA